MIFEIKSHNEEELPEPIRSISNRKSNLQRASAFYKTMHRPARYLLIADIESDYRFIISDNYISFYRAYGSEVYIDRILYARRDYMRILFGDSTTDK